jgi:hypothetical protein
MIRRFFQDWPWKLACLLAAVAVWLAVASEPEMATVLRVPIQYKLRPGNLEISSEIVSSVQLELLGVSGRLKEFSAVPAPVVLDFSTVRSPGERTFNIDGTSVRLPKGVQLIRAVPAQLRYVFEDRESRSVPVEVQWSGVPRKGGHIVRVRADPSTLDVVGPRSRVDRVISVQTDPVNLDAVQSGKPVLTSPFIAEPEVRFSNFQPVRVTVILKN